MQPGFILTERIDLQFNTDAPTTDNAFAYRRDLFIDEFCVKGDKSPFALYDYIRRFFACANVEYASL